MKNPAYQRMLEELKRSGIDIADYDVITTLRPTSFDHARAVPVFLRWLPELQDPREKETVVRHLTGEPEAARQGAASILIEEFAQSHDFALKWALGNALATVATEGDTDQLIDLLQDRRHGTARQMLCDALKRTKDPRAPDVLVGLVDDEDVAGHAILALRLYGPRSSLPHLRRAQPKLAQVAKDEKYSPFSRQQAGKALERLKA